VVFDDLGDGAVVDLLLLLSASREGEEKKQGSSGWCRSGGSRGCGPTVVLWHSTGRSLKRHSVEFLSRKKTKLTSEVSSPNYKRHQRSYIGFQVVYVLLAGTLVS
jgi:hypothetical protein